jgi:putative FmdB family regulatory protein
MPTYEYACSACGEHLEVVQSFRDDALTTCPNCGGDLRKVFGSIGVVFKGSGFYKTDSRPSGKKSEAPKSTSSPDTKASEASSSTSGGDKSSSSSSGDKSSSTASPSGSGSSSSGAAAAS